MGPRCDHRGPYTGKAEARDQGDVSSEAEIREERTLCSRLVAGDGPRAKVCGWTSDAGKGGEAHSLLQLLEGMQSTNTLVLNF